MPNTSLFDAKILIVEPHKLQALLLEKILKKASYTKMITVSNTEEIIHYYATEQPDLILFSLDGPEEEGFRQLGFLKQAKKEEDYLPLIILTSDRSQDFKMRALESGATDIINKPYEEIEIVIRVHNLLETRLLHRQVQDQNTLLEEKVKERTAELREAHLDAIHRLARAAEYRDNDTGLHIIRMSHYCAKLAKAVGLSESQCELMLHASPLHDIGKIGIPDNILLKPGKLTDEEWEIMKTHTTLGGELLAGSRSPLMRMAEKIALTHHEKWDGSGYPNGLKDDSIPLVGRICSVCDVFDALTSDRPYKKAWTTEEAVAEIERLGGKHFDPKLIQPFKSVLPEIKEIQERYAE